MSPRLCLATAVDNLTGCIAGPRAGSVLRYFLRWVEGLARRCRGRVLHGLTACLPLSGALLRPAGASRLCQGMMPTKWQLFYQGGDLPCFRWSVRAVLRSRATGAWSGGGWTLPPPTMADDIGEQPREQRF